ncbi:hypothetical protein BGZ94_003183 [Podila epigama]|nr:hypothetical protein BGZ94_003183 [Podila epigama]
MAVVFLGLAATAAVGMAQKGSALSIMAQGACFVLPVIAVLWIRIRKETKTRSRRKFKHRSQKLLRVWTNQDTETHAIQWKLRLRPKSAASRSLNMTPASFGPDLTVVPPEEIQVEEGDAITTTTTTTTTATNTTAAATSLPGVTANGHYQSHLSPNDARLFSHHLQRQSAQLSQEHYYYEQRLDEPYVPHGPHDRQQDQRRISESASQSHRQNNVHPHSPSQIALPAPPARVADVYSALRNPTTPTPITRTDTGTSAALTTATTMTRSITRTMSRGMSSTMSSTNARIRGDHALGRSGQHQQQQQQQIQQQRQQHGQEQQERHSKWKPWKELLMELYCCSCLFKEKKIWMIEISLRTNLMDEYALPVPSPVYCDYRLPGYDDVMSGNLSPSSSIPVTRMPTAATTVSGMGTTIVPTSTTSTATTSNHMPARQGVTMSAPRYLGSPPPYESDSENDSEEDDHDDDDDDDDDEDVVVVVERSDGSELTSVQVNGPQGVNSSASATRGPQPEMTSVPGTAQSPIEMITIVVGGNGINASASTGAGANTGASSSVVSGAHVNSRVGDKEVESGDEEECFVNTESHNQVMRSMSTMTTLCASATTSRTTLALPLGGLVRDEDKTEEESKEESKV